VLRCAHINPSSDPVCRAIKSSSLAENHPGRDFALRSGDPRHSLGLAGRTLLARLVRMIGTLAPSTNPALSAFRQEARSRSNRENRPQP
jgi:hypothetical protein